MTKRLWISLALTASLLLPAAVPPETAEALVVFDPANFSQNILQAIRALESNMHEAKMIANQIMSLANQARNLKSLRFNIINDFSSKLQMLFAAVGTVDGLMQHVADLESRFEKLYPDLVNLPDLVPRKSVAEDMHHQLSTTREMMLGAAKTGGQVLAGLPQSEAELAKLMTSSQGAIGILQATQAGNQIAGTIAGQLINLNTQFASYTQAHTAYLMELNSSSAAAKNRMDHVLDGFDERYTGQPLPENPF
jgi:type IV secretion system protein TrbJ